jgi:hypothetical protein
MSKEHTEAICNRLTIIANGLDLMGGSGVALIEARDQLCHLQSVLDAYLAQDAYKAGHSDGWRAAFETGLVGGGDA